MTFTERWPRPAVMGRGRPQSFQPWSLSVARLDAFLAAGLGLAGFVLYAATAAPSVAVLFDDTLEFQVVIPTLGIAHPSGYPLYTLLGKLFTLLVPLRDAAGRLNLLSALLAACAVAVYCLAARRWSRSRLPAFVVAASFALSPVWWSQATLAEVYALHGLLVALFLYFLLRWEDATLARRRGADRWLAAAACTAGLGMAHHRMIALLLPAALVFLAWTDPGLLRQPRRWLRPMALGLVPLLLYSYLPLRGGAVSSLDGTYVPTVAGTLDWITARGYNVFLTGNPFNVHRDVVYYLTLFQEQLGLLLFTLAGLGLLSAWRFGARRYVFLLLATVAQVLFGLVYKVQDVEVFFLPAFMLAGLWAALGILVVLDMAGIYLATAARGMRLPSSSRPYVLAAWSAVVAGVLLYAPIAAAVERLPLQDRSHDWTVYDAGEDMLASAQAGSEIAGLGGEITLARYFRDVLGRRPDLRLTRADGEAARFAAVDAALAAGRTVYLTRDLPGAAARYSLSAAGPLIQVRSKAAPAAAPAGQSAGAGIVLTSAATQVRQTHAGPVLRLNLAWSASVPLTEELKVSARLLDGSGKQVAQSDAVPVHFTYPTTAWVPGEIVDDVYDLPLPSAAAGSYTPLLVLYRAADASETGRVALPLVDYRPEVEVKAPY